MQASHILSLKTLLPSLAMVVVLAAPCASAKKDLFANDPGAKQSVQTEQLVSPTASSSSSSSSKESAKEEALAETVKSEEKTKSAVAQAKSTTDVESEKKSSYLATQFSRLKDQLIETKDDLFGGKSAKKEGLPVSRQAEASLTDSAHSSEEARSEVPTISAAEAAQRAQTFAEGQVINVRKYQEENQQRYAVKLLQKNGRMKTINLDAVSGALIEEKPTEETPQ